MASSMRQFSPRTKGSCAENSGLSQKRRPRKAGGRFPRWSSGAAPVTTMYYKGSRKPIDRIGCEVAGDYVVEDSILRSEDRLVANVRPAISKWIRPITRFL